MIDPVELILHATSTLIGDSTMPTYIITPIRTEQGFDRFEVRKNGVLLQRYTTFPFAEKAIQEDVIKSGIAPAEAYYDDRGQRLSGDTGRLDRIEEAIRSLAFTAGRPNGIANILDGSDDD